MKKASEESAVVFFDVDGTLIEGEHPPSVQVARSIRNMADSRHVPVLCTGRPICHLAPELSDLPWTGVVTLAGASVRWEGGLLYRCTMPIDLLQETMDCLWREKIEFILQGDEECCFVGAGEVSSPKTVRAENPTQARQMFPTLPFVKLELKGDTLPGLLRHEDFLKQHFSLQDIGIGIYELALPNINKENAVRLLLDAIGHSRENTYAIGDSENDLGMLEAVQTPIAMGNALPHVKKKAVWVTDTVRKDGVYTALQHFGLIEKCETKKF